MSFFKNLFSGPYKPVNSLEKALQDVIANPKRYETFHKELLNSEIFILGNVTQEGHLNLIINPLENFSVIYLFTSEEILNDMVKREKKENMEWVAIAGDAFFDNIKDNPAFVVQINIGCGKMNYLLSPEERHHISTHYR